MNKIVVLLPLGIFVLIGMFFAIGLMRDPARIPSQLIDKPLPEFDLPPLEGFETGLVASELTGEVALLNVWGSWCVSCHLEHPFLMELSASGEIPIYGLNWRDQLGDGAAWLARFGNPYTLIGKDVEGRVAIDLGVTGAPETFIIDREGRVRYKHVGPITENIWRDELLPLIEELRRA